MEQLRNLAIGGAGGGCFRKGTPVQLEHGKTIAIEKLKVGDEILAFDEQGTIHKAKVTQVHHHTDPQPILSVKYWGGEVEITPNHWVLNEYNAFSEIGRLTIHDCVVDGMGHLRPIIDAKYIGHEEVYNLTVEPHHTFIAGGIRVHNGGHRDLYPTVGGAGGGGKSSSGRAPVEAPDSLQSRAMISVIDLLGEGQIGGLVDGAKSIYLNDTPLQNPDNSFNFEGFTWEQRFGTPVQEMMTGDFGTVETPTAVNVQVKKQQPATFTVANPNADEIRLVMLVPALSKQNPENGDISGTAVEFKVLLSTNNAPYEEYATYKISGKTRSRYQRAYRIVLPREGAGQKAFQWTVQVQRITPDSEKQTLTNDLYVDSYSTVINTKLTYPNSAVVGVTIDSSQFSSIPKRSYLVDGLIIRVPKNYDPKTRIYTGSWDGSFKLAVSDNPAWILYDLLTAKRYGLGEYIDPEMVDEVALYQIGRYCDELVPDGFGGREPRFTINTAITGRVEAYQLIRDISSVFNGMTYWTGGKLGFMWDAPSDPVMIYNQANVIDGRFQYSGSSRKDRHSVVLVSWVDPKNNYTTQIEYIEDPELIAKYGVRKAETIAFGCTSQGQANRVGRWLLYTERYQSEMVVFSVGLDSALVKPGDIVKIHDTTRAGARMGGRLVAVTSDTATLDFPCNVSANSIISLRMPDGSFVERPILRSGEGLSVIEWTDPLPEIPTPNSIWLISSPTLEPQLAKVVSVDQGDEPGQFRISALMHYEGKYDLIENGIALNQPNTSILDLNSAKPITDPRVDEFEVTLDSGMRGLMLDVSWTGSETGYEVQWKREGEYQTNWQTFNTSTPGFTLDKDVQAGTYVFRVAGMSPFGVRSEAVEFKHTTVGKVHAPGDVYNFKVTKRTSDLLLTWDAVKDIELLGYEIRVGQSWDDGKEVIANFAGTMITHDQDFEGTYYYHIRSINRLGVPSKNVTTAEITLNAPESVKNFDVIHTGFGSRLELVWSANKEPDLVHYEIREGDSWGTSQMLAQVKSTSFTTPRGIVGSRRFWIKAVTSPGIYSKDAAWVGGDIIAPAATNIIVTSDQQALGFPGAAVNMVHDDTGGLTLKDGYSAGEYVFELDLGYNVLAQTSMATRVVPVGVEVLNWTKATWAWNSFEANRPWAQSADSDSISHRNQISLYRGVLDRGQVEAWSLNQTLQAISSLMPSSQSSVGYVPARFAYGLNLSTSKVEWQNINSASDTFHFQFWINMRSLNLTSTQAILELGTSDGKAYRVAYNESINAFEFSDTNEGSEVCVAHLSQAITTEDLACVSVVQTKTHRKVFVGIVGKGTTAGELAAAPLGIVTALRTYWQ